jgi:integrase
MLITDVDFDAGSVTIREKKGVHGKDSTRRTPLTTTLTEALQAWRTVHRCFAMQGTLNAAANASAPPAIKCERSRANWRRPALSLMWA